MELLIMLVLIIWAYYAGRRDGIVKANRSGMFRGAWVELTERLEVKTFDRKTFYLEKYTQAIVKGVDHWGQVSIWLAEPPLEQTKGRLHTGIKKFSKFKIIDPTRVYADTYEEATKSLALFKESASEWHIPGIHNLMH